MNSITNGVLFIVPDTCFAEHQGTTVEVGNLRQWGVG